MFVTATDFDDTKYGLPNLEQVENNFQSFVDREEELCLRKLLGNILYEAFTAGLNTTPVEDIPAWCIALRDGANYKGPENRNRYQWKGMKSIFIPYIYALWTNETNTTQTGVGVVKSKAENSDVISPMQSVSRAFNDYAAMVGGRYNPNGDECLGALYGYLYSTGIALDEHVTPDGYSSYRVYLDDTFQTPHRTNMFNL